MPARMLDAAPRSRLASLVKTKQYGVPLRIDQLALGLCVAAPEQEDQALALARQGVDDMVGETFPALALVRSGLAVLDGDNRDASVEQLIPQADQALYRAKRDGRDRIAGPSPKAELLYA